MATMEHQIAAEHRQKNRGTMHLIMDTSSNKDYATPRPASRVGASTQAMEILLRNRGTLGPCIDHNQNKGYQSARPGSRVSDADGMQCLQNGRGQMGPVMDVDSNANYFPPPKKRIPPGEGEEILRKSVNGSMASVLNVAANKGYYSARPAPRVPKDAADNANKGRGLMDKVLDNKSNMSYSNARQAPKVKPEAEGNATKGRGMMSVVLDTNANARYVTPRAEGRVKPEAASNAHKGKGVASLVITGQLGGDPVGAPRVKPEADDIANKNKGTLTNLLATYGKGANSSRAPKIKGQGEDIYLRGTNGVVKNLFQQYGALPRDPKPACRVKPEAKKYANQGKGSMGSLLAPKNLV